MVPMQSSAEASPAPTAPAGRALKLMVGLAAVVVAMLGLSQLADIVAPAFLALNLMIVVWPLMAFLSKRMPRIVAAILTGLAAMAILVAFFWALGWAATQFIQEIPQYKDQGVALWQQMLDLADHYGVTSKQITDQLKGIDPNSVVSVVSSIVSNVSGVVGLLAVVLSVLVFLIIDSTDFEERLERLGQRHKPVLVLALQSFAQGVRRYWVTSTVFGLIVAVVTWLGLLWIGVPLALVWAVLSFVTNYIPNIGFVIGLIPAAVMGFLTKGVVGLVLVVVLYSVSNFVIQSLIQPKFTGEAVGVTTTVSFLSLLLWAVVLGPLGALLALPATQLVKALVVDADPNMRWVNTLIASNPKTSAAPPDDSEERIHPIDPLSGEDVPASTDRSMDPSEEERAETEARSQETSMFRPADDEAVETEQVTRHQRGGSTAVDNSK